MPPILPSVVATFYQSAPANEYAAFWHKINTNVLAYGFDYDDVYNQNPSVTAPQSASPVLTDVIGWN